MRNHIAMVDALLIAGAVRRPVRFVMYYKIFNALVLSFIFRTVGAVPIAGRHKDKQIYEQAFARIAQYLQDGELVCIFPEGKLTTTGEINEFRNGIERIIQETPVLVVLMALQVMWGSFFSRYPTKRVFKRFWSRIGLVAGEPIAPEAASRQYLQERVSQLRGDVR